MSSRGSVTYGVAKELAKIFKPLTGNTIHHVNNSSEFADDISKIKLEEGECIISYDVSALFTSIPVQSAIQVIKKKSLLATQHQWKTSKTIGREGQNIARAIKEAIYIRVINPTLNRNIGKYNLPHIWNKVLFSIPELKTKKAPLHNNSSALRILPTTDLHNNNCAKNKYLCTTTSVLYEVHQ